MEPHTLAIVLKALSLGIATFVVVMMFVWICRNFKD